MEGYLCDGSSKCLHHSTTEELLGVQVPETIQTLNTNYLFAQVLERVEKTSFFSLVHSSFSARITPHFYSVQYCKRYYIHAIEAFQSTQVAVGSNSVLWGTKQP